MKKFNVTVKGIVPLLQARHLTPQEEIDLRNLSDTKSKKKAVTDEEQYEAHAYKVKGKYYQPSEMFEAAMTKAAASFRLEGKKTYKDVIKGGILITPMEIVHKNQKFSMDARWGKNPNTRGAIWVVRPRIDEGWELNFQINLLQDERVSPEVLKQILEYAGLYVGIGAWRPKFGQFKVSKFEEVKA